MHFGRRLGRRPARRLGAEQSRPSARADRERHMADLVRRQALEENLRHQAAFLEGAEEGGASESARATRRAATLNSATARWSS